MNNDVSQHLELSRLRICVLEQENDQLRGYRSELEEIRMNLDFLAGEVSSLCDNMCRLACAMEKLVEVLPSLLPVVRTTINRKGRVNKP